MSLAKFLQKEENGGIMGVSNFWLFFTLVLFFINHFFFFYSFISFTPLKLFLPRSFVTCFVKSTDLLAAYSILVRLLLDSVMSHLPAFLSTHFLLFASHISVFLNINRLGARLFSSLIIFFSGNVSQSHDFIEVIYERHRS